MYVNELIPKPAAEKAVRDYALLYTKVEGAKQYIRNRYNESLKALQNFKKALKQLILWGIPTIILLIATLSTFSANTILGVIFAILTLIVIFKWSGRKLIKFLKSIKLQKFAKACEKEFLELNKALGGKFTNVWTNEFINELVSLVGKYMYHKYDHVNKDIRAFNKKYCDYRDFVNLDNQWDKTPILAEIFKSGLATSIVEALREYERKKDAEEIKGMQRTTLRALEKVSDEVKTLSAEVAANTAATLANAAAINSIKPSIDANTTAINSIKPSIDANTTAIDDLNRTLKN